MKKIAVMLVFVASIIGCDYVSDDNDDDVDLGTAPEILDVVFRDEYGVRTEIFTIGELANVDVQATDPDKDMETIYVTTFLPNDAEVPHWGPEGSPLPSVSERTDWFYNIEAFEVTGPAGDYRIEFEITDAMGNDSDVFRRFIVILEP